MHDTYAPTAIHFCEPVWVTLVKFKLQHAACEHRSTALLSIESLQWAGTTRSTFRSTHGLKQVELETLYRTFCTAFPGSICYCNKMKLRNTGTYWSLHETATKVRGTISWNDLTHVEVFSTLSWYWLHI